MSKISKIFKTTALATLALAGITDTAEAKPGNSFSLGVEGFYYRYREPGLMEDKGSLYGLNADYFHTFSNSWFLGTEARVDFGKADYKSQNTGRDSGVKQFIYEQRGLVGFTFVGSVNTSIFTGLGYRYKSDHGCGTVTTTGHLGYDRYSQYLYLPVGLRLNADFSQSWDWQATGEFDWLITGRQNSDLATIGITRRSVEHKQSKGWGVKLDYLIGYKMTNSKIAFGPFLNYWNIKKSNEVMVATNRGILSTWEPKNTTVEAGLKAKWSF
jgi:hypothetical protein